jgi:phosphopantothenoylcysteine decarboxylase / phosphopantothenate---cysteine ligase
MNILISAGPTLEPIDAVRFISNRSSGKMGVALADLALKSGDEVVVVHGPLSVPILPKGKWIGVERASEMMEALALNMEWADVLIMAAAVCDMRPVHSEAHKLDKSQLQHITLMPNPDVVGTLARSFPKVHVVTFSLENNLDVARPLQKMRSKNAHWVVYNQLQSMGADSSTFGVIDRDGREILAPRSSDKALFAQLLVDALHRKLEP